MDDQKKLFDKGIRRRNFNEYNHIVCKSSAVVAHRVNLTETDPVDTNWRRLKYVRYADDFIVGFIGSLNEVKEFKEKLKEFLYEKLKLELNESKTLITHNNESVKFLGYSIGFKEITYKFNVKGTLRNARRKILTLFADDDKVIKKLYNAKFCKRNGDSLPCFQYMHQTQSLTNQRLRSFIIGLSYYYNLANNKRRFINRISFIIKHSAAKMYAAKFKLRSRASVFKIAGRCLGRRLGPDKGKKAIGATDTQLEA